MEGNAALCLEIEGENRAICAAGVNQLRREAVGNDGDNGALVLLELMNELAVLAAPHTNTTILPQPALNIRISKTVRTSPPDTT